MKTLNTFLSAFVLSLSAIALRADTITGTGWKGTAGNNSWSSTGNWDSTAPNTSGTGDRNLFFGQGWKNAGGSGSTTANNDLSGWHGYRITFQDINNNGATDDQSFTITGNGFTVFDFGGNFPRIENDSFVTQTFTLTSGQTLGLDGQNGGAKAEINPINGNIVFSLGTKVNLPDTTQLQIFGSNGKTLTFNDVLSSTGTNNSVALNGNSILVYFATNTYGGDTYVNNGTLRCATNDAVNTSTFIRLGDTSGANSANLNLDGGRSMSTKINVRSGNIGAMVIANTASTTGTATFSGNVFLDKDVTLFANSGGTVAMSGSILDFKNQTLIVDGSGSSTLSGSITNSTGSGKITKNGSGTLTITGNNTNTGVITINAGAVNIQNANALGSPAAGTTVTSSGAELQIQGGITTAAEPLTLNGTGISSAGALHNISGNNTFAGPITLASASRINSDSGTLTLNSSTAISGTGISLSVGGAGNVTISSVIGTGAGTLTKDGSGIVTLAGNNTYTGSTTVSGGSLLVNGSIASGSTVTVQSGGTLGGTGTVSGSMTIQSGGTLSPGVGIGTLTVATAPTFQGTNLMEINTTNSPATNDMLVLSSGTLAYGGTLTVTNTGPAMAGGESFTLFSASAYSGSFSATNLPSLASGLNWYFGFLNSSGKILVNRAPSGTDKNYSRAKSVSLKIRKTDLLVGASDPDAGDSVSYDALTSTGTQGATVTEDSTNIYYIPANDNSDTMQFRLKDTRGGAVTKNINITVTNAIGVVSITNSVGGSMTISFAGIPGFNYVIQRSPDLVTWTDVVTNTAPSGGQMSFTETPPYNPAYYRTRQP